jgi:hypothetical protein
MNGAAELVDYLMRVEHLLVVAAVWFLQSVFCRVFPRAKAHKLYARIAPVVPLLLCSGAVWIPGVVSDDIGIGSRIFLGVVLGALTANAHKIFGQTVLGRDDRIKPQPAGTYELPLPTIALKPTPVEKDIKE